MLTANVDISDRLINGQIGTIKHIITNKYQVSKLFVKFDVKA